MIVDDHVVLAEGLKAIIEQEPAFVVSRTCRSLSEALKCLETFQPDCVITDISMPGGSGIDLAEEIHLNHPEIKTIILTMYNEREYFERAMEFSVSGYLLKDSSSVEIINCLWAVFNGKKFISSSLSDYLLETKDKSGTEDNLSSLTAMEKKIISLLGDNLTSIQIAEKLNISYRTVQKHRDNIASKLGLTGHNKLLEFAIRNKNRK